jgi:hypothetical protein
MDLATNLWSQLEFKDRSLLPGEAKALWDLTLAKSAVQQAFWSSLGNTKPDQAKELADSSRLLVRKLGGGPDYLTRTAGLVKSERTDASLNALFVALPITTDLDGLSALVRALHARSVMLTPEQDEILLRAVLDGLRKSTDPAHLKTFVAALEPLLPQLTAPQIRPAYDTLVQRLREGSNTDQRRELIKELELLMPKLTAQIEILRDAVKNGIRPGNDFNQILNVVEVSRIVDMELTPSQLGTAFGVVFGEFRATTNDAQLSAVFGPLLDLIPRLPPQQFRTNIDPLLNLLSTNTATTHSRFLADRLPDLVAKLTPEQTSELFGRLVQTIQTKPNNLKLIERLLPRVASDQIRSELGQVVEALATSRNRIQARTLASVFDLLVGKLMSGEVASIFDNIVKALRADTTFFGDDDLDKGLAKTDPRGGSGRVLRCPREFQDQPEHRAFRPGFPIAYPLPSACGTLGRPQTHCRPSAREKTRSRRAIELTGRVPDVRRTTDSGRNSNPAECSRQGSYRKHSSQ